MKKLEKNEMKRIQGGKMLSHTCHDNGSGTSSCNAIYQLDDGRFWICVATYNYDGTYAKGGGIDCNSPSAA